MRHSPTTADQLLAYDREHLWHPYTSMTDPTPTHLVTGADGVRLTLADVGEVVDGMSSWWAAIHGYRHPALDAALKERIDDFSHVMFGGLTHEPAVRLAERLVEISPSGLDHVFLAEDDRMDGLAGPADSLEGRLRVADDRVVQCGRRLSNAGRHEVTLPLTRNAPGS